MTIQEQVSKVMPIIEGTSTKTGDKWYSRDLILVTNDRYQKEMAFTFKGGNVHLLDAVAPGDRVEVSYDIESREANGRYFTTLFAWKINILSKAGSPTAAIEQTQVQQPANA